MRSARRGRRGYPGLERRWEEGDPADQLFGTLKGSLHTLKGNSAMMGLTAIQALAHCMEDVCAFLGERPDLRPSASGLLLRGAGVLVEMVGRAARGPLSADRSEAFIIEAREFIQTESVGAEVFAPYPERRRFERRTGSEVGELGADGVVSTIRVDARRLDGLLETFGETMIAGLGLREAVRDLAVHHRGAGFTDLEHALTSLEKTLKRLEGALMATRLVSIATVFGRFNLLVREVANANEKRVRLVTSGGETQLDKTVIDRLGEPLVHLVTNAVIHGLESPEDRERAGKPAEATVTLSATQRSDRVILTVTDDGRGLDPERILHKARHDWAPSRRTRLHRARKCLRWPFSRSFHHRTGFGTGGARCRSRCGGQLDSHTWRQHRGRQRTGEGHQVHDEPSAHSGGAPLPAGRG